MRGKRFLLFAPVFALLFFLSPARAETPSAIILSSDDHAGAAEERAKVSNGRMTSAMQDGKPLDRLLAYTPESPAFFAVAELESAPPNTKIRFSWIYVTENQHIADFDMTNGNHGPDVYVYSNLTNGKNLWPKGEYKTEIYVGGRTDPDQVIDFEVE